MILGATNIVVSVFVCTEPLGTTLIAGQKSLSLFTACGYVLNSHDDSANG